MTFENSQPVPCSILVPVFNAEKHIKEGLASIVSSARGIDQIVVVDDGSSDNTVALVRESAERDSRIVFRTRQHFGLVNTLNYGLECCDFELVARADIDDFYAPNRIEKLSDFMSTNQNVAAAFSDYSIRGTNSQFLGDVRTAILPNLTKLSLITSSRTPHPSVIFRKSVIQELGGYQQEHYPTEDLALWVKVSSYSEIASLPLPLLNYTLNPSGISAVSQEMMLRNLRKFQSQISQNLDLDKIQEETTRLHSIYSVSSGTPERFLSLLRDLITLYRFSNTRNKIKCAEISLQILSQYRNEWFSTGIEMRKFQQLRKNYRLGTFK
jgi:glycosyltransferase involved in cell wall biosynthesis